MRILCGIAIVTLGFSAACASRSDTTATTTGQVRATSGGAAAAGAVQSPANTSGAEAAARLTPQDLDARMKNIGSTYPAMRMQLMANQLGDAAKAAQQLATWFGDVERFWAQNSKPDAVKWSQDARTFATEVAGTATAGDAMKATQAAANMQGACKQCHGTYREADPAGGFRIKAGVLTP